MIAFILLLSAPALAQDLSWEFRPATTTVQLGEPVAIEGAIDSRAGDDLKLNLEATATDYFALRSVSYGETELKGDHRIQHFKFEVVPLALGRLPISTVWSLTRNGRTDNFKSPTVELAITEPPLGAQPRIKDIKGPRAARPALWPWLLAAGLAWLVYEIYRRRKRRQAAAEGPSAPTVDLRPPEAIALSELDLLESSRLWEEGRAKEFYIRLTEILRRYLERRFSLPATRLTTAELVRSLRRTGMDKNSGAALRDLLNRADLVKFAKIQPETSWGGQDLAASRFIVAETSPKDLAVSGARS